MLKGRLQTADRANCADRADRGDCADRADRGDCALSAREFLNVTLRETQVHS